MSDLDRRSLGEGALERLAAKRNLEGVEFLARLSAAEGRLGGMRSDLDGQSTLRPKRIFRFARAPGDGRDAPESDVRLVHDAVLTHVERDSGGSERKLVRTCDRGPSQTVTAASNSLPE